MSVSNMPWGREANVKASVKLGNTPTNYLVTVPPLWSRVLHLALN